MPASFDIARQQTPEDCAHPYAAEIAAAWNLYEGRHPAPLRVAPGDPDDSTVVNLVRGLVDRGIAFLFGKPITWQADETTGDSAVEAHLARIWAANDQAALLLDVAQNGFLAGLAAIKVDPQPDKTIRLITLDPATLTLAWTRGDVDDITGYAITFAEDGRATRQEITRNGGPGSAWTIADYAADAGAAWSLIAEPIAWPYALPPIVHCKNLPRANCVWGYSDLADAKLNAAVNTILSASRKTVRIHATPQTIGKGVKAGQLKRNAGGMWEIEKDADVYNLEMQSDLRAARQLYLDLRAALYEAARTPDLATLGATLGQITNFGLRVLFADQIARNETKRVLYGGLIVRLNRLLALLGGYGPHVTTTIAWPDPLPVNALERANEIVVKQKSGLVSAATLTAELGYRYQDETARLATERAAAPTVPPPNGSAAPTRTTSHQSSMHQEPTP